MSRYRKVDPRIWNDAKFRDLSDSAKLVFFFLLTHPHMTAIGAMRATVPGLAAELGWSEKGFRKAFEEALSKGMAKHDEKASFVWLPKFLRYNPPESPNVVKAWKSALDLLPECPLFFSMIQHVKGFAEDLPEAFTKALPEAFAKAMPNQEQEQEQEQEQNISPPVSPPSTGGGKRGRTSRLPSKRCPPDFEVTDDMVAWAREHFPGVNIEHETAAFRDYEFRSAKTDWPATWRNWIRKAAERSGNGNARSRPAVAASFEGKEYDGTPEEELPAWARGG